MPKFSFNDMKYSRVYLSDYKILPLWSQTFYLTGIDLCTWPHKCMSLFPIYDLEQLVPTIHKYHRGYRKYMSSSHMWKNACFEKSMTGLQNNFATKQMYLVILLSTCPHALKYWQFRNIILINIIIITFSTDIYLAVSLCSWYVKIIYRHETKKLTISLNNGLIPLRMV